MIFKKACIGAVLGIVQYMLVYAAPFQNEPHQFRQPDGTLVDVIVTGDEFFQDVETLDGYSLVRDTKTDWICYAKLSTDGSELLSTGIVYDGGLSGLSKSKPLAGLQKHTRISAASLLGKRKVKYLELNGEPYEHSMQKFLESATPATHAVKPDSVFGLTILVDFPDTKSAVPRDSIVNWLNMEGYTGYRNKGSVRDFYYDMSVGKLVYKQLVTDFITAQYAKSHYDTGTGYGGSTMLINEICATFKAKGGFDFSKVTISGNYIQATNILYAGTANAGWANGLWPHSGTLRYTFATGVQMSAHMLASIGASLSLGAICHENGHMLCKFPDLYAYDNHSHGAGNYDLMSGGGGVNPEPFGAFLRSLRGWMRITDITNDPLGKVYAVPTNSDVAFTWSGSSTGSAQELYCIEARRRIGRSATLPDSGLLIWHIDKAGDNTTAGKNDYAVPEQADGKFELEDSANGNSGNPGDLWRGGYKTRFNDTTAPPSLWHNKVKSGIQIANVSKVKDTMSFSLGDVLSGTEKVTLQKEPHNSVNLAAKPSGLQYSVDAQKAGHTVWVSLRLYGINGQLIATLVNGVRQSGKSYFEPFTLGGKNRKLARCGVYLCTLEALGIKCSVQANIP